MEKKTKLTRLAPATRQAQIERWGLARDGSTADAGPDNPIRAALGAHGLMRAAVDSTSDDGNGEGGWRNTFDPQDAEDGHATDNAAARGFLRDGGWHVVHIGHGVKATGMRAHRGPVHPDEYVDSTALRLATEVRLGASADVVRDVYGGRRGGPLPRKLRPIRDAIDLALAEVENVARLAEALGMPELAPALRRGRERGLHRLPD